MHDEALFIPETMDTLDRVFTGRRAELQRKGRPIGEHLFAEEPDTLVARMRHYWDATQEYGT